jgi:hypothetical protein
MTVFLIKVLLSVLAVAVLSLVFFISGCGALHNESSKDAVGLSDASVGDIVVFGDLRWYVIAKTDTGCTLLCEKPVIKSPFNEAGYHTTGTWEDSTLRAWLNKKFYNTFTEEEKALIAKTHNINPDNREYGTPGGNDTDDHIFLLSVDEANVLDKKVRHCGYWYGMDHQWWWLRSPGNKQDQAVYILGRAANLMGTDVDQSRGVRPAIRVRYSG